MYVGPEPFQSWSPYGGAGEEDNEPGQKMPPPREDSKKSCIGIDFDGTLTLDPRFFKKLVDNVRVSGGKCYLITGRSHLEKSEVESYLKLHGIRFDGIYFYPIAYYYDRIAWDSLLGSRIGVWKAKILSELGADVMIDNDPIIVSRIVEKMPKILVLKPVGGDR
jgi:hypothetical protein